MTKQTTEIDLLAAALFDAAFPGERERDPYWFMAYETDWRANAERLLASSADTTQLAEAMCQDAHRPTWWGGMACGRCSEAVATLSRVGVVLVLPPAGEVRDV